MLLLSMMEVATKTLHLPLLQFARKTISRSRLARNDSSLALRPETRCHLEMEKNGPLECSDWALFRVQTQ